MEMRGSKPGERRGGRQKGTPNKVHRDLKTMILASLDTVGGEEYLVNLAKTHPPAYATLLGKILPTVVAATVDQTVTLSIEDKRQRAMKMLDAVFAEPVSVTIDAESVH